MRYRLYAAIAMMATMNRATCTRLSSPAKALLSFWDMRDCIRVIVVAMLPASRSRIGFSPLSCFCFFNAIVYLAWMSLFSTVSHRWMRKPWGLLSVRFTFRSVPVVVSERVSVPLARMSRCVAWQVKP